MRKSAYHMLWQGGRKQGSFVYIKVLLRKRLFFVDVNCFFVYNSIVCDEKG